MNRTRSLLLNATVAGMVGLLVPAAGATNCMPMASQPLTPQDGGPSTIDAAYSAGTRAMNESRWSDAIAGFDKVINSKGQRVDAALYWKAYSLTKLGREDLSDVTCAQLHTQFVESRWNRDCAVLHLSRQVGTAQSRGHMNIDVAPSPHTEQDRGSDSSDPEAELKLLALNSLMHREPSQAVPLLRGILTGDQPASLKGHALFVLAQSRSTEADALMRDLVFGKMGPELQRQSIQASGIYKGRRADDMLVEAYRATGDAEIKHTVISALFVANDDQHLVDLAHAEHNLELKRSIVSQLALMNGKAAQDYMLELLK